MKVLLMGEKIDKVLELGKNKPFEFWHWTQAKSVHDYYRMAVNCDRAVLVNYDLGCMELIVLGIIIRVFVVKNKLFDMWCPERIEPGFEILDVFSERIKKYTDVEETLWIQ